ncbi:MAG: A/G-specific adenine glycosylase [Spirochaetaceae bacterium]|jgi:A/G-specific adenine glycosylase|nr:A/G-specific adenine glycosylase [Spirochaetaceae bacterium]
MQASEIADFQRLILDFYRDKGRDFAWRRTEDPYAIMVSEFMLQQTQTERALPYYEHWFQHFPTLQSLAGASLADVLVQWSGLGYNRRGRFLQEAARIIVDEYGGVFPDTADALDALPGIGPYTARAIICFAFNRPEYFIETNIRTVYMHHFSGYFQNPLAVRDTEIISLIKETLLTTNPRIFYYALMDYGAMLKKTEKRINQKSAHYSKQSRFEGSLRQARGAILRALSRSEKPLSLDAIAKAENIDHERLLKAAAALEGEDMLIAEQEGYRIPRKKSSRGGAETAEF